MKYHSHLRVEADVSPEIFWRAIVDILGFSTGMCGLYGFGPMQIRLLDDEPSPGSLIEVTGNKGSVRHARLDDWDPEHTVCEFSLLRKDESTAATWKFRAGQCAQNESSFVELDIILDMADLSWRDKLFEWREKLEEHNLAKDYLWSFQQRVGMSAKLVSTNVKRL